MEVKYLKDALFGGMTNNGFKLGTVLTGGWFWVRRCGCLLLFRAISIEKLNASDILTVADKDAERISPPGYLQHRAGETYFYVVRRVNLCGALEQTLEAIARVSIDSEGKLAQQRPNSIAALSIEQNQGSVKLSFCYCPLWQRKKPALFKIYSDNGSGQIDYENPIATIEYERKGFYCYQSSQLSTGRYKFAVRAEDEDGVQDGCSGFAEIEAAGANVPTAQILSAEEV